MKRWLPFWGFKFHLQTLCWSVYQDAGGRDFLFILFVLRQHRLCFLKSDWSYPRKLNNLKHFQEYTRVVLDGSKKKSVEWNESKPKNHNDDHGRRFNYHEKEKVLQLLECLLVESYRFVFSLQRPPTNRAVLRLPSGYATQREKTLVFLKELIHYFFTLLRSPTLRSSRRRARRWGVALRKKSTLAEREIVCWMLPPGDG